MSTPTHSHSDEPSSGGSEALKAFRAQLAAEAAAGIAPPKPVDNAHLPKPEAIPSARGAVDMRAVERKIVNGRTRVTLAGGTVAMGKLLDLSRLGASVMVDDLLAVKKSCTLDCDIFHNGKHYVFSAPAVSVHAVLVSGKGFKVGFEFGPYPPAVAQTLDELLK